MRKSFSLIQKITLAILSQPCPSPKNWHSDDQLNQGMHRGGRVARLMQSRNSCNTRTVKNGDPGKSAESVSMSAAPSHS